VIRDELSFLFKENGAKRYLSRARAQKANAILPLTYERDPRRLTERDYLYADDRRSLTLCASLVDILNKEFPTDLRPSGFCGPTAVPGDWNVLRNVSGIGMDPLPLPLVDNQAFIKASGLDLKLRAEDGPLLDEVIRLFFGAAAETDLHIRKQATTSFPYFTSDNTYKKMATMKIFHNVDDFLNAMCGGKEDLEYALSEYHCLAYYAIFERKQPNAISFKDGQWASKPRTAPTIEEARSGLYTGKTFADMTARDKSGAPIDGHFAMRRRDVFGMNGPLNYFMTAVIGFFRAVYLERFAFTYKVRSDQDKADRLRPFPFVVGSDVKTMDKLIPRWFIDHLMAQLPKYLDERFVTLMSRCYHAPYCSPGPWAKTPESYDPCFGDSPLDPGSFTLNPGLPSGIAYNPDIGKLWMTFNYLVVMRDLGVVNTVAEIEPFLLGKNRKACLLDSSDDAAFGASTQALADALKKATSPYAILEPEVPVIYLGGVFTETSNGMDVFPNPITFLANLLCREDSIDRKGPAVWAEGFIARSLVYSRTPIFRDLVRIFEEQTRKHVGINPTLMARSLSVGAPLNDVDAMVRANPAVLHYKVDPSTVSKEVLDEVVATIPARDFAKHIKHLFKVPIASLEHT